jgi:hypothetical protein
MMAFPPNSKTHWKILSSSVTTKTSDTSGQDIVRWYTCPIIGIPAIGARGLPGKRLESYLDGTKAITVMGPKNSSLSEKIGILSFSNL